MAACDASYTQCYDQCKADIPFWKFGKRQDCFVDCTSNYATCLQTQEGLEIQGAQQKATSLRPVYYIMAALIILVVVGKWQKWF